MSILINGKIPAGVSCPYSYECEFKYVACNGEGCPVTEGNTVDHDFSCGAARLFALIGDDEDEI